MASPLASNWSLDPSIDFLNHGSYGATPTHVLQVQAALRDRMEADPVQWFRRDYAELLDRALGELAMFVGAQARDLAPVRNATTGVNAVVRSLPLETGDELVTTNHAYPACRSVLEYAAARRGAVVRVVDLPFEGVDRGDVVARLTSALTRRTRLVLASHVTSPTALVLPVHELVAAVQERGVDVLVDGAHAPGMVDVDVELIGAAYYTGNCHKWMCAPKGAGFLHVREDRQQTIVPAVVSEGYGTGAGSGRFRAMFDWVGTDDVTPLLAVPAAIEHMAGMVGGGWAEVRRENRLLALAGREEVASAIDVDQLPSAEFVGSMASLRLPDGPELVPGMIDPLEDQLFSAHGIEVPVVAWPEPGKRLVRLSAQRYNEIAQYRRLAAALAESFR